MTKITKTNTKAHITYAPGITSLDQYEVALMFLVDHLKAELAGAEARLKTVRQAKIEEAADAAKAEGKASAKAGKAAAAANQMPAIDTTKPVATQMRAIAKHLGLKASSVYSEKTKTKGRKIKLHSVYSKNACATKSAFEKFESMVRTHAAANGIVINDIKLMPAPAYASYQGPSFAVFFKE
jgi:hypothetical protein